MTTAAAHFHGVRVRRLRQRALPLLLGAFALGLPAPTAAAEEAAQAKQDAVLQALELELARSMAKLGAQEAPPYFLSYEVTETQRVSASAAFGSLSYSDRSHRRSLDVDVRVGDYALDNSRHLRESLSFRSPRRSRSQLALDDDVDAMRSVIWNATDRHYKRAVEQLTKVRSDVEVKVDAEDQSADFSKETPAEDLREVALLGAVDLAAWEDKVRRYSQPFADGENIHGGRVGLRVAAETRWFVNSEGARVRTGKRQYQLTIDARTIAEDGMALPRYESFYARDLAGLPNDAAVMATVRRMIDDLEALRDAPIVDPYAGPALLSGRAAGVFFHEVLGHRVEGHRQKREDEGQTFKKKVGERILPEGFSITFDPTRKTLEDTALIGAYDYDNEGVAARPVAVVEDGVFKRFLMSRSPIEGFPNSNGHGRKSIGYAPVARQSNLIVEATQVVGGDALKERLLAEVRAQGKEYGLLFEDIQGGFTLTGRDIPNAFNVQPILVYRIYPDGREELVRGVDLIGTPLVALSHVVAAGSEAVVFNGTCGAESGGVPVSAVSPAILVSQIEVQKKRKSQRRPPLLPPPPRSPGAPQAGERG